MTDSFHGVECAIYGAGRDMKPFLKSASVSGERGSYDASALANLWRVFRAGRVNGEFNGEGFHSTGAGEFSEISEAIHGTRQSFMLCPEGEVAGSVFGGVYGSVLSRAIDTKLTDMTMAVCNVTAKKGADLGRLLTPGAQTVVATGFTDSVDTGIADDRGGALFIQCLAYAGTAGKLVVGLEDSADNITFAAVAGTAIPTADIVENFNRRIEIPAGQEVRRYVRAYWTVSAGLTSADIVAGVCKYYT